jgi:hypothetical protein
MTSEPECSNCGGTEDVAPVSFDMDLPTIMLCRICSFLIVSDPVMFNAMTVHIAQQIDAKANENERISSGTASGSIDFVMEEQYAREFEPSVFDAGFRAGLEKNRSVVAAATALAPHWRPSVRQRVHEASPQLAEALDVVVAAVEEKTDG